jgi:type III secretory pathway lipoprotein EscJ
LAEPEVQGLVAGAVAGLEPANVTVVAQGRQARRNGAAPKDSLVPLGPFAVSPASAVHLRTWLVLSASLVGLLGLAVVFLVCRGWLRDRRHGLS